MSVFLTITDIVRLHHNGNVVSYGIIRQNGRFGSFVVPDVEKS